MTLSARISGFIALSLAAANLQAQNAANVLVVINDASQFSREIGAYYSRRRIIPEKNVCHIRTSTKEEVPREQYDKEIAARITACLARNQLIEQILYIVTTSGVPLRISGSGGLDGDISSVDSELTLLYSDKKQHPHSLKGGVPNPFFGQIGAKFNHSQFPIYLVTRLAAYDVAGVKSIIDASLAAKNRGKFVVDMSSSESGSGNSWLQQAANLLPKERVVFDASENVLYEQTDVIGYASWGSNDKHRHRRFLGFHWLPGSIATEFVSTDARTFNRPPANWNISDWDTPNLWFAGSPQSMTADYLLEGATNATGHVAEPYLDMTPHPEFLLPAYYSGRNLAESFYLSIRLLSWQNIVIGDPLCSLGPPER